MKFSKKRAVLETDAAFVDCNEAAVDGCTIGVQQSLLDPCMLKEMGCSLAESGDFGGALNLWLQAVRVEPDNSFLYELIAQGYMQIDKLMVATFYAENAVKLNPTWDEGMLTLARCQREMGELELSLSTFRKACLLNPDNVEIRNELREVEGLVEQLLVKRAEKKLAVDRSETDAEKEANLCIYHLSARASSSCTL